MSIRVVRYFILILVCPVVLFAQERQPENEEHVVIGVNPSLTMREVVDAAMAISPDQILLQSKSNYTTALSNKASSLFSDTPQISINHQNDSLLSNQGLREWESSLDLPLWMPGQKSANRQKARMSKLENDAYEKLTVLQITGLVRELLWELELADFELKEAQRNLKLAESLNDTILKRIAAGNLPKKDSILGSSEVMDQKIALLNAQAEYIHVAKRYESLTGLTEVPEFIEETLGDFEESHDFVINPENSPILALADAKLEVFRADYKISKSSWSSAPVLSFGVKRERAHSLDRNIDSVRVGVSVPLGATSHMTSKRSEAAQALAQAEREKKYIERDLKLAVHEAEHELEMCAQQLPILSSHFELAEENLRLSQKAFDMGESSLLDLLKIQEQFFVSSRQNKKMNIECKRAIARQNQIRGVLLP